MCIVDFFNCHYYAIMTAMAGLLACMHAAGTEAEQREVAKQAKAAATRAALAAAAAQRVEEARKRRPTRYIENRHKLCPGEPCPYLDAKLFSDQGRVLSGMSPGDLQGHQTLGVNDRGFGECIAGVHMWPACLLSCLHPPLLPLFPPSPPTSSLLFAELNMMSLVHQLHALA